MYKKLLTKIFFRDNPLLELSTQRFVYGILTYKGIEEYANEVVMKHAGLSDERLNQITREKEQIQAEQNPDELFNF